MNIGQSFVNLGNTLSWVTLIFLAAGVILCAIEVFMPGFGHFGMSGSGCVVIGLIIHSFMCKGDYVQILILLFFVVFIILIAFFVMLILLKTGHLNRSIVQTQTALPEGKTGGTKDYAALLGKTGVVTMQLRPVGKAEINGVVVDVVSYDSTMYETGTKIVVTEAEGARVTVKKSA